MKISNIKIFLHSSSGSLPKEITGDFNKAILLLDDEILGGRYLKLADGEGCHGVSHGDLIREPKKCFTEALRMLNSSRLEKGLVKITE